MTVGTPPPPPLVSASNDAVAVAVADAVAAREPRRRDPVPIGDDWTGVIDAALDAGAMAVWATVPAAGAVVSFSGTVRDHAPGRDGVTGLTYEAYEDVVVARIDEVVVDVRRRWPEVLRVVAVHRVGDLAVGDVAVVVVVSAPHRAAAFAAASHCIDTIKGTVPLWKKETWSGGEAWGTDARPVEEIAEGPARP